MRGPPTVLADKESQSPMSYTRTLLSLSLVLGSAALLAGCGGGGGGGGSSQPQTNYGSITGKVVDAAGNPVPTAVVLLDSTSQGANTQQTTTVNQGGYVLSGVTPGFHTVFVSTTVNNQGYTGTTQVEMYNTSNNNVTNANVIVALPAQQATVSGTVTDSTTGSTVPNAEVFFQSAFANPSTPGQGAPSGTLSTASLVAFTDNSGAYTITLPVYQGTGTTPRVYTASAAYRTGDPTSSFGNVRQSNLTFTAGATVGNVNFALPVAGSATNATPTISDVEAITQPLDPAFYTPGAATLAAPAAGAESASVYEQIHRLLSPQYAHLIASGHAAARVKHLASAAQPHIPDASQYGVEMDVFFSLPGDAVNAPSAVRDQLSGFQIGTDAFNSSGQTGLQALDFLQDPLANFYTYQDIGSTGLFLADTQYNLAVQSYASDGVTPVGAASVNVAVAPLAFVNMVNPPDPIYNGSSTPLNNPIIGALPATNPVLQWTMNDPHISGGANYNVGDYYVFLYSTFPGVTTSPIYTSGALSVGTTYNVGAGLNSFTVPVSLTAGHQYWVVVAATAASSLSGSSTAISLSQITPFTAQ